MTTTEQTTEVSVFVQKTGLEKTTAQTLISSFEPFLRQANEWKKNAEALVVTDRSETHKMKMAREARLALKKIRTSADAQRKLLKEDSIRYGKAVQGVYNIIEYTILPIEEHLEAQEKFIEIEEAKEREALAQVRLKDLDPYMDYVPHGISFGDITEEDFQSILLSAKTQHAAQLQFEIEQAEKVRKEKEEQERIKAENERLKKEAQEREEKARIELKRLEDMVASRSKSLVDLGLRYNGSSFFYETINVDMVDVKTLSDREWVELTNAVSAVMSDIKKREKAESDAKEALAAEQRKREEEEMRSRIAKEAQAKAQAAEAERIRQQAMAPDKDKLMALAVAIEGYVLPEVSDPEMKVIVTDVRGLLNKVSNYIKSKI